MHDFHLHLARLSNPESIADELNRRVYHYVDVGCEPWEWTKVRELHAKVPHGNAGDKSAEVNCTENRAEKNRAAFGLHPMIADKATEEDFATLRKFLESDPDAQVGEAGLDRRFPGYCGRRASRRARTTIPRQRSMPRGPYSTASAATYPPCAPESNWEPSSRCTRIVSAKSLPWRQSPSSRPKACGSRPTPTKATAKGSPERAAHPRQKKSPKPSSGTSATFKDFTN